MEFVYQFSASGKDYSEVFSHYQTRDITREELMNGIYGQRIVTFGSLEELIRFEDEVGDIVIANDQKKDGSPYKAIIIYDDYLE